MGEITCCLQTSRDLLTRFTELVSMLYNNVIRSNIPLHCAGRYEYLDVLDAGKFESIIVENRIDLVLHFSAILSALGELNVQKAIDINIHSVHTVLEVYFSSL